MLSLLNHQSIMVPTIYFWEEKYNGKPTLMTAAVQYKGMNFGLSFPLEENVVQNKINKRKLTNHLKEVASVLCLHDTAILNKDKQLDPKKINDAEAMRFFKDKLWVKRVKAVHQLLRVKEIIKEEAKKMKLL